MKKLMRLLVIVSFILVGCSQLKVKVAENLRSEYGEELDNSKLFDAAASDEKVEVQKVNGFNNKKLGDQTIKVIFTDGDRSIEKEIKVTVEDTKKPEIVLDKDTVTITAGDKLELKDNIKSVKDPIEGDLKYSDKKLEKAGYYFESNLDATKAGTYEVKVLAYDANGNVAEKIFKVVVEEKKEIVKNDVVNNVTTQQTSTPNNVTSNASVNTDGSNLETPPQEPSQQCRPGVLKPGAWTGNSGMTFHTMEEAWAWGEQQLFDKNSKWCDYTGFHILSTADECGNPLPTVEFY